MLMSEKITVIVAVWIIVALFITADADLEVFFVLVLIGFIVINEFTDRFTGNRFKLRMNALIFIFMIAFIIIIGIKIISF